MNIVIPMAGRGSRLAGHPSGKPKPFIEVHGKPLWWWAATSMPLEYASKLIFVCLQEHLDKLEVADQFRTLLGDLPYVVHGLDAVTSGQLSTVLTVADHFDPDVPVVVYNADSWLRQDHGEFTEALLTHDGVIGTASAPGDQWSFVCTNEAGLVTEIAEKRRISDTICTGLYAFRNPRLFVDRSQALVKQPSSTLGEHYVSGLYDLYLDEGCEITTLPAQSFHAIGTPEELAAFSAATSSADRAGASA